MLICTISRAGGNVKTDVAYLASRAATREDCTRGHAQHICDDGQDGDGEHEYVLGEWVHSLSLEHQAPVISRDRTWQIVVLALPEDAHLCLAFQSCLKSGMHDAVPNPIWSNVTPSIIVLHADRS